MKKLLVALSIASLLGASSYATVYNDAVGDTFFGGHMDIVSVEVQNDLNDIFFTITVGAANPGWGNYMIGIQTGPGGDSSNPWVRPISFASGSEINYWVGSWTDGGGGSQLWSYNGSWSGPVAPAAYTFSGSSVNFTFSLASLGLSVNDTLFFDVFSSGTGGTDAAIDALNNPNQTVAGWSDPYISTLSSSYTVVPEPSSLALLALGGLAMAAIRRRQRG
ncbi:MAG TPA: PEP-CTERM sorting domain-containing protein [Kiritimatiellia bacterium]|nr:PEP-CTERM sorting domain-containing protein [Kiritimatiellia bacterium]